MSGFESLPLLRIYDLRNPDAWRAAHRHRGFWGKLYTDVHALGADHVALVFGSGRERWRPWGGVRPRSILGRRREGEEEA
jgi:hypothetical protein